MSSYNLCPACGLPHRDAQLAASFGPICDYKVCYDNMKNFSEDMQSTEAKKEFIKCTIGFIREHSAESYKAMRQRDRKVDMPIITKPVLFYRNSAVDTDNWRRRDE